jgi:hypothetical protein
MLLLRLGPDVKVEPDPAVLAFTLGVSITTGILFGLVPGWKFSRLDVRPGNAARVGWRTGRFSSTQALITMQIALSFCLLIGAGLLTRSFVALEDQDLGFTRNHILLIRTDADLAGYQPPEYAQLYREITDRMNQLPGVQSAAISHFSPISGYNSSGNFSIQGYQPPAGKEMQLWDLPVGPRFFETLRIPISLGRAIEARDTAATTPVAVVNQTFVQQYFPGTNPVGQHIEHGAPFKAPGSEIVGVSVIPNSSIYVRSPNRWSFIPSSRSRSTASNWSCARLPTRTASHPKCAVL